MQRSKLPYIFLILSAILAIAAVAVLLVRIQRSKSGAAPGTAPAQADSPPPAKAAAPTKEIPGLDKPLPPDSSDQTLHDLGLDKPVAEVNPETLVQSIAKALEGGDFDALARLLGKEVCDEKTRARLKALAAEHPIRVRKPDGIREIGELELNTRTRWSLELEGATAGRDRIYLDLLKNKDGWSVEKMTLPPLPDEVVPRALLTDALGTADSFLQAVLRQDFEFACDFVDPKTVSDVKIATLCILFEEGQYRLRSSKPLRAMFQRGDTAAYIAHVETTTDAPAAEFSITLRQPAPNSNWRICEINLDRLLADYAQRVAGGDIYYSPLVKNPEGGDTLALYFEFDEDDINPRTRRQLEIVAQILKADPGKKISLSGHTDALGTEDYNNQLSARRAVIVRDFLAAAGVSASQIQTQAKGASQPRRPNVTETGQDDPRGRRANRRTEIYLDF